MCGMKAELFIKAVKATKKHQKNCDSINIKLI